MTLGGAAFESYVVEQYLPRPTAAQMGSAIDALRRAAADNTAEGTPVQLAGSILLPADDLCLHVLTAASPEAAVRTAERAQIAPERVIEATVCWLRNRPQN